MERPVYANMCMLVCNRFVDNIYSLTLFSHFQTFKEGEAKSLKFDIHQTRVDFVVDFTVGNTAIDTIGGIIWSAPYMQISYLSICKYC